MGTRVKSVRGSWNGLERLLEYGCVAHGRVWESRRGGIESIKWFDEWWSRGSGIEQVGSRETET